MLLSRASQINFDSWFGNWIFMHCLAPHSTENLFNLGRNDVKNEKKTFQIAKNEIVLCKPVGKVRNEA